MSDSEILAVIEEQARTNKEAIRKFMDFCNSTEGAGRACRAGVHAGMPYSDAYSVADAI